MGIFKRIGTDICGVVTSGELMWDDEKESMISIPCVCGGIFGFIYIIFLLDERNQFMLIELYFLIFT